MNDEESCPAVAGITFDDAECPLSSETLQRLLTTWHLALDAGGDPWQFAIGVNEFYRLGVQQAELRWLAAKCYVEHAYEITATDAVLRTYREASTARILDESAFVLSAAGVEFATQWLSGQRTVGASVPQSPSPLGPRWDALLRELRVGDVLVKRFGVPAASQQIVLTVFEEEGWPPRIDDPLPRVLGKDPKGRVRTVVATLNRHQQVKLLRFRGDGTGTGICWEWESGKAPE